MTGRDLVSTVRSSHKVLSNDSLLNDRSILSEVKAATQLLVKRETNLRKLWATDTLFTTLPCLGMQEVSISECCDYVDNCTVSRTIEKLPRIAEGNYQYVIQGVWSINAMGGLGTKFKEITINRYLNLLKLPIVKNDLYFWIVNDYLYTNNSDLEAIRMAAYFEEDLSNNLLYPDCDCTRNKYTIEQLCQNPLDRSFPLPGYLEKQVLDMVSQRLLSTYFNLKTDQTQNLVDGQAKNTQPTD